MKKSATPKLTVDPTKVKSWNYRLAFLGLMLLEEGGRSDRLRVPDGGRRRLNMKSWHGGRVRTDKDGHACGTSCCVAGYSHFLFDKLFEDSPRGWEGYDDGPFALPVELRYLVAPRRLLLPDPERSQHSQRRAMAWYLCSDDYGNSVRHAARRIYMLLEHPEFVRDDISESRRLDGGHDVGDWSKLPHNDYFSQKGVPDDIEELRRTFQHHIDHTPCLSTTV